jgi:glycosyltransferase involved in cell wall biosynthesis
MRQIYFLNSQYRVTAIGFGSKFEGLYEFHEIELKSSILKRFIAAFLLLLGRYDSYYWSRSYVVDSYNKILFKNFDVVIANDLMALPLGMKIAEEGKSKLIFDAHEYAPREFEDLWRWRFLFQSFNYEYCKRYLPKVDGMMTVCQGIADEYEKNFGVKPVVITNAPAYYELTPSIVQYDLVRMIHHGGAMPSRHLDGMIEMMDYLEDRFTLDFMLVPSSREYLDRLKVKASSNNRIRFLDPVPMQDIPKTCNMYDIGVYLLPPVSFNSKFALPNKLFEFIQARIGVAIGPSPEMARIVKKYKCGVVADDFSPINLAAKLNALTADQVLYFKNKSHAAAKELCAEANAQTIIDLVEGV